MIRITEVFDFCKWDDWSLYFDEFLMKLFFQWIILLILIQQCASFLRFQIQQLLMAQRQKKVKDLLYKVQLGLLQLKNILLERFTNDNSTIQTNHGDIRTHIYNLTSEAKPTTKEKVVVNQLVRENIQDFIHNYVSKRLAQVDKISKDPHQFVTTLNEVWNHYQVFVFSHYHVCQKLTQFFTGFYKMNNGKDYQYRTKYSKANEEVVAIPVIGVNQLKKYFEEIKLIQRFKGVFNQFLLLERQGKNVPRAEIRDSLHSLQSCYFDMDAFTILQDKKPLIIKRQLKLQKLASFRRSKDTQFFNTHLMNQTLANLNKYYIDFVDNRALAMSSTDQIRKLIEIIKEQQSRALYYIHSEENRKLYYENLYNSLIRRNILQRLTKQDGFKKYVEDYDEKKDDYVKQIKDLWFVYSRMPQESIKILRDIFANYLASEAEKVYEKAKKPPDYIEELIKINGKCLKIVEFCANSFELQNERNNKIRGMLSNDITQRGRKDGKFDVGAKNLASYINNRFRISYTKGGLESLGETYKHLVGLFKNLQEKTRFIDEESRHMANRLLEQIQFSQDKKAWQIIALQKSFIEQIQKECGVAEIRELVENIKDIEKSIDINNKMNVRIKEEMREPLKQIIIKNAIFWPERSTYTIQNPPKQLVKPFNVVLQYFKKQNTNILFQFNSGVSLFQGDFDNKKKQRFYLKNIYMIILLYVEEEKSILYGNLKKKMQASGINKNVGVIQLSRAVIELLHAGLLVSPTKSLQPGTPNICRINETDQFHINRKYDFIEQEKKKKGGKGPVPKAVPILRSNILSLNEQLKMGFSEAIKQINDDQKNIESERRFKVECIAVKALKHAHHHQMNCTFQQLFQATQQGRNKQYRVTERYLMEILENLINKDYCERLEGQRNVFRYIA